MFGEHPDDVGAACGNVSEQQFDHQLPAIRDAHLPIESCEMCVNGGWRYAQSRGDGRFIVSERKDALDDLRLACGNAQRRQCMSPYPGTFPRHGGRFEPGSRGLCPRVSGISGKMERQTVSGFRQMIGRSLLTSAVRRPAAAQQDVALLACVTPGRDDTRRPEGKDIPAVVSAPHKGLCIW